MSAAEQNYVLYALPHSLYSGKARSYLRYKGIPYREVVSTFRVFYKTIIPRTGVKYIPVLHSPDDVVVQDTTDIIDFLEARFPQASVYPRTPRQRLVSLLFELYGDEWLLIPAMHYRWSFWHEKAHIHDVLEHFGMLLSPRAPRLLRRHAGKRFCQPFSKSLPLLGIHPHNIPALETWYEGFIRDMSAHFARHPYLLGGRASIGDFGLMGPLYAHLGRDFHPKALMQKQAPHLYEWVQRMNRVPQIGEFLPGDTVPETLLPVLRHMFAEHFPLLLDTVHRLETWLEENPERRRIPRVIGDHEFVMGGVKAQRKIFPYSQWMLQRALDYYQSLQGTDKASVDALLREVGGFEAMQASIRRRVRRVDNRLVADPPQG
jgi:glutathione S-transferase